MARSRSPLKAAPRRNPGQSLDEWMERLVDDETMPWVASALSVVVFAAFEWFRWFREVPPQPEVVTAIAIVLVGFAAWRILVARRRIRTLRLGRDGERAVGQFLEEFRPDGFQVFHDVLGDGFNVDHVLIGPKGVFTIETKTLRKPLDGDARIVVEGERVLANRHPLDRDPLVQARAQARWVRDVLAESTGRRVEVHPMVVFPGWYVDSTGATSGDVRVLNPRQLPYVLDRAPDRLKPEDVSLLAFHLSRLIRADEARAVAR